MKRAYPRHIINLNWKLFKLAFAMILRNQAAEGGCIQIFERKFAEYIGVKYTVGVNSARNGLYLILKSFNFNKNDEVIVPAYTFHALPMAVIASGLKPVFVDVQSQTYNINPLLIEGKINSRTRAILLTHMFGQPCDMDLIIAIAKKFNLIVIEDCAHACGAVYKNQRVGSLGDAAVFSFKIGKNLPCFGGGMITTNNKEIYDNFSKILQGFPCPKRGGVIKDVISAFIGYCATQKTFFSYVTYPVIRFLDIFNLDCIDRHVEEDVNIDDGLMLLQKQTKLANLQAVTGLEQLEKLDALNEKQRTNAQLLIEELKNVRNVSTLSIFPGLSATFLYFRIKVQNVKLFRKRLLARGVDTKRDDMSLCSQLKVFEKYKTPCPEAEKLSLGSIEVPNDALLNKNDVMYIAEQIKYVAKDMVG